MWMLLYNDLKTLVPLYFHMRFQLSSLFYYNLKTDCLQVKYCNSLLTFILHLVYNTTKETLIKPEIRQSRISGGRICGTLPRTLTLI